MRTFKCTLFAAALTTLTLSAGSAFAGEAKAGGFKSCASRTDLKGAVYTYLTGKKTSRFRAEYLATTPSDTVKLNSRAYRREIGPGDAYAIVSLPYSARGAVKLTVRGGMSSGADGYLCEFALKSSARSWSSFRESDLVPVGNYSFSQRGNPTTSMNLNARAGDRRYKDGRVVVIVMRETNRPYNVDISLRGANASKSSTQATTSGSSGNRTRSNRSRQRSSKKRRSVDRSGRRR